MNRIIYERLRLSHSVPITYKEEFFSLLLSPPIQAGTTCTTLTTRPILNKHTHKRGCWLGTMTGWEKLVWQTDGDKEAGQGRGRVVWEKCVGGHINPSTKAQ